MGDHFALMRDRLITEATLQVVIESINSAENTCGIHVEPSVMEKGGEPDCDERLVQCRICHDEDLVHQMDAPCSCTGSLKVIYFLRDNV
jgi:RING-variant domain